MTPIEHLRAALRRYPATTALANSMIEDRGTVLPDWPDWCLLPMAGWYAIVSRGETIPPFDLDWIADVSRLAALGTWQFGMDVFRFEPGLLRRLADVSHIGGVPLAAFQGLPAWCVYVEGPGLSYMGEGLDGFWAHLEWDVTLHRPELRLLLNQGEQLSPVPLHLGDWDLTQAAARSLSEGSARARAAGGRDIPTAPAMDALADQVAPLLAMLLWLCAGEADVAAEDGSPGLPHRAAPQRRGRGYIPSGGPKVWTVRG